MTDGHLTDEQLSSHLDRASGADRMETAAASSDDHLAVCARCRQRSATLESVRQVLQRPVPPVDPEVRSASIASVVAAASVAVPEGDTEVDEPAGSGADAGRAPTAIDRRRPQVLVGAAAAVLVLAVAIGVPLALAGKNSSQSTASRPSAGASSGPAASHQGARGSGTAGISANATDNVSDLGKVSSLDGLRPRVAAILPGAVGNPADKPSCHDQPAVPDVPDDRHGDRKRRVSRTGAVQRSTGTGDTRSVRTMSVIRDGRGGAHEDRAATRHCDLQRHARPRLRVRTELDRIGIGPCDQVRGGGDGEKRLQGARHHIRVMTSLLPTRHGCQDLPYAVESAPGGDVRAVGHESTGSRWHRRPGVETSALWTGRTRLAVEPSEDRPADDSDHGRHCHDDDGPAQTSHHASHAMERRSPLGRVCLTWALRFATMDTVMRHHNSTTTLLLT